MGKLKIDDDTVIGIGAYTEPIREEYDCSICGNKDECGKIVIARIMGRYCNGYMSPKAMERSRIIQEYIEQIRKGKEEKVKECREIIHTLRYDSPENIEKAFSDIAYVLNVLVDDYEKD